MKNKDNSSIGFAISSIKTEQFAIFEENYSSKKETELSTELQFKLEHSNKHVGVYVSFEFIQGKKILIKIQISCYFRIDENSWKEFEMENKIIIPKGFLAHLAMITTGTSRGILFAKTEATPFAKFIIPTINIAEMITENAVFDIPVN